MEWTLVTGGARRLGAQICVELAGRGMPILVHYRKSEKEACEVVERCRLVGVPAESIRGDFSTMESTLDFIAECRKRYPGVKNLINNVGNYLIKSAANTTPEEWAGIFQTNLHAPFALCHGLLPGIVEAKGSIVNIGVVGINNIRADVSRTAYATAKMSLWMLTKSLARELAPQHVRVNMVSPGHIEGSVDLPKDLSKIPMGGAIPASDVTRVIAMLLDAESRYITGQNIEIGGGLGLIH